MSCRPLVDLPLVDQPIGRECAIGAIHGWPCIAHLLFGHAPTHVFVMECHLSERRLVILCFMADWSLVGRYLVHWLVGQVLTMYWWSFGHRLVDHLLIHYFTTDWPLVHCSIGFAGFIGCGMIYWSSIGYLGQCWFHRSAIGRLSIRWLVDHGVAIYVLVVEHRAIDHSLSSSAVHWLVSGRLAIGWPLIECRVMDMTSVGHCSVTGWWLVDRRVGCHRQSHRFIFGWPVIGLPVVDKGLMGQCWIIVRPSIEWVIDQLLTHWVSMCWLPF